MHSYQIKMRLLVIIIQKGQEKPQQSKTPYFPNDYFFFYLILVTNQFK